MALNPKALQKKRAKKTQQRKETRRKLESIKAAWSFGSEWATAAKAPLGDVFVPRSLFEQGIGSVWFSRRLSDGRYAVAVFLIDLYCLGVKNALYALAEPQEYERQFDKIRQTHPDYSREHPAYARKLVEGVAAYAKDLGFDPHPDYKLARLIFGDVDASTCPAQFTFGRDGKPFYINGPNETLKDQKRIVHTLEERCGPGGYDYIIGMSSSDEWT
jgi:hypothetical protein